MQAPKEKTRFKRLNNSCEHKPTKTFDKFRNTNISQEKQAKLIPNDPSERRSQRRQLNKSIDSTIGNLKNYNVVTIEEHSSRRCKYIPDNIMFNDSYIDNQQNNLHRKKLYPKVEMTTPFDFASEGNSIKPYCAKNSISFQQKVKQFHGNDLLKIMNRSIEVEKEECKEIKAYSFRNANAKKKLASTQMRKAFIYPIKKHDIIPVDKVNSYPAEILKISTTYRKKEPNYGRTAFCTNEISNKVPSHAYSTHKTIPSTTSKKTNVLCHNGRDNKPKESNKIGNTTRKNEKHKGSAKRS